MPMLVLKYMRGYYVAMTDRLRYENFDDGITLHMPDQSLQQAYDKSEPLQRILSLPKKQRSVDAGTSGRDDRLSLNFAKAGRLCDSAARGNAMKQMVVAAVEAAAYVPLDQIDPRLTVLMSTERVNQSDRFGMMAWLGWPEQSDENLQQVATEAMRHSASTLRYDRAAMLEGMVYAQVSRKHGITLETNPAGSCSLDTDGSQYREGDLVAELHGHNLYQRQMQLICLSGLTAIARS